MMFQDHELMEGAPTPQTTVCLNYLEKLIFERRVYFSKSHYIVLQICKTRRIRRRSSRRAEAAVETDESDSDMDQPTSSRTESSNQLDSSLKNKQSKYNLT